MVKRVSKTAKTGERKEGVWRGKRLRGREFVKLERSRNNSIKKKKTTEGKREIGKKH